MFNKKPRRNFRQRKDNSSDEEDERKTRGHGVETEEAPVAVNKPEKLSQGRGITCSSKREATPPKPGSSSSGEDGDTVEVTEEGEEINKDRDQVQNTTNSILSFSDDKEGKSVGIWSFKSIFLKMDSGQTFTQRRATYYKIQCQYHAQNYLNALTECI